MSTLTLKKDVVLRNKQNKQCFINMVSEKLKEAGCDNIHAAGDADVLIGQSAVSVTATRETSAIADDMHRHFNFILPPRKKLQECYNTSLKLDRCSNAY